MSHLVLTGWHRSRHQLFFSYSFADLSFSTSFWYADVDLQQLEQTYGKAAMANIYFHIAAFDINKIASLRPDTIDWGPFANLATKDFAELWLKIFHKVWAQWRWENDDPHYEGPKFAPASGTSAPTAVEIEPADTTILQFCGGGKDSLVSMKLLERGNLAFDSFTYSSSCYGLAGPQHELMDSLLSQASPNHKYRQWIYDDFLDSPVLWLYPEMPTIQLTAAETPSSVFAALPYALANGQTYLALGHERSADTGQVYWEITGESVNHQWGKSYEAEYLLNEYVRQHLVSNVTYFSILKPIYDVLIFNLLRQDVRSLPFAHSCNINKPWCKECPKCAYVWLSYMAWLPTKKVNQVFDGTNLFDIEKNQKTFIQLLGQADRLPFECIGQAGESQLAFELCRRKGIQGKAMQKFIEMDLDIKVDELLEKYTKADPHQSAIPSPIWDAIEPQFTQAKNSTYDYVRKLQNGI